MKIKPLSLEMPETSEAFNKIVYWFFSFPTKEFGLNEIVKELKISKTAANKVITQLIKENFLERQIIGKNWRLKLNQNSQFNLSKKIPYNLELILKSNLINLIQEKVSNIKSIILFGSYRKGDDIETSDIDIAVQVLGNKKYEIQEFTTFKKFGFRKNIKVELHIFSDKNINNNLLANIRNGIVLEGFLE